MYDMKQSHRMNTFNKCWRSQPQPCHQENVKHERYVLIRGHKDVKFLGWLGADTNCMRKCDNKSLYTLYIDN